MYSRKTLIQQQTDLPNHEGRENYKEVLCFPVEIKNSI